MAWPVATGSIAEYAKQKIKIKITVKRLKKKGEKWKWKTRLRKAKKKKKKVGEFDLFNTQDLLRLSTLDCYCCYSHDYLFAVSLDTESIWPWWRLVLLFPGSIGRFFKGAPSIGVRRAVPACSLKNDPHVLHATWVLLGWEDKRRGCGKEKISDDAVPHAHKNLHKSVLLGFGLVRPCSVRVCHDMPGKEKKNSRWNYCYFLPPPWPSFSFAFPFLPCTKPFWDTGSWSTVYMTPRFLYILLCLRARLRETTEVKKEKKEKRKKKRKEKKKSEPLLSCQLTFFPFPVLLMLAWFCFLFSYMSFPYSHIQNYSKRLYLPVLDLLFRFETRITHINSPHTAHTGDI